MLDSKKHIQQAKHNEQLAEYLTGTAYADWRATSLFYAALHFVQAYFLSLTPPQRYATHFERDLAIENDQQIGGIWSEYRSLKDWSTRARYNGVKPNEADFKSDILKSLAAIKKQVHRHVSIK